jgi:hypothetical protein
MYNGVAAASDKMGKAYPYLDSSRADPPAGSSLRFDPVESGFPLCFHH